MAAALSAATVFLVHAAADWVWHMPSVGLGFFMLVGILAGASGWTGGDPTPMDSADGPGNAVEPPPTSQTSRRATPIAIATVLAIVVIVLATPQLVSSSFSQRAASLLAQDEPELAIEAATWAARFDPIADRPHLIAAKAYVRQGDWPSADREFERATRRDPTDYRAYLAWGDATASAGGDPTLLYETAAALNPLSTEVRERQER